jgi:hypothetical protein
MNTWFPILPTPLAKSPVGLIITDPVFRQKEPDPLLREGYLAADLTPLTSTDLWNYFTGASTRIDLVGTQITNADMVQRLAGAANKGVEVNMVVEEGYFNQAASAPLISQLMQTGHVTIKTDKDGIARQVHSHYAVIDNHVVLASSGDFLDDTFNASVNDTLVFNATGNYINGTGPSGVQSITDAFLFDFDQMFNLGHFGGDKERFANHTFDVGVDVEVYFGPNDDLLAEIANEVNNMQSNMSFMIGQVSDYNMLGILAQFAYAGFYDVAASGDLTTVLPLATPFYWSGYNYLNHKIMAIDVPNDIEAAQNPLLLEIYDPTVIFGSCDWTYSGLKLNDEQLIIVHDLTIGYEIGYVEFAAISREATGYGVVFGKVRTMRNVPIEHVVIACDSQDIAATPFGGDGGTPTTDETDPDGRFLMFVPSGFVRNIHLEDLGDAAGAYLFPDPLWGETQPNQGYNLLPGASLEVNFYLRPIPTNTGTGT